MVYPLKMVIFHSYVSLPEGIPRNVAFPMIPPHMGDISPSLIWGTEVAASESGAPCWSEVLGCGRLAIRHGVMAGIYSYTNKLTKTDYRHL